MTTRAIGLIAVVLLSSVAAPAALAAEADSTASAESTLSFGTDGSAVVDYAVGGTTVAESIRVQSRSQADADLSLDAGASLGAVTNLTGSPLAVDSETGLQTTIRADSGATLSAHDNGHGSLVVASDGDAQVVEVGLPTDANATADGDSRVVVTTADGTTGTYLATGDGSVTVNDAGNVTASVDGDSRLVFRAYADGRDEADRQTETLITSGQAAASVYLTANGSDSVTYDGDTDIAVTQRTTGRVNVTVDRAAHEGTVIVTSVAESTFESPAAVQVAVDGQAAARASSTSELTAATQGGETSRYMVRSTGSADASMDVLVGVNHFSERTLQLSDGGSDEGGSDADPTATSAGDDGGAGESATTSTDGSTGTAGADGPGFGVVGALAGVLAATALLGRRR